MMMEEMNGASEDQHRRKEEMDFASFFVGLQVDFLILFKFFSFLLLEE